MVTVPINPRVLSWAIDESGQSADDLAEQLKVAPSVVRDWLSGDERPTQGQWTKLADKLKRPRSVFLFAAPPAPTVAPALRTSAGRESQDLGSKELLQVRRAKRLQQQVSRLRRETGAEPAIPASDTDDQPSQVARTLRRWLDVSVDDQLGWESSSTALGAWRAAFEEQGVLVLQLQLGKGPVRGFSLLDGAAPLVAVNTAETNEARIFTMVHELAHLSTGDEASCALPPTGRDTAWRTERWCDRVAASVLLPVEHVRRVVTEIRAGRRPPADDLGLARRVASRFSTSLRSSAIRLQDMGLADDDLYDRVERAYPGRDRDKPGGGGGGGERAPAKRLREMGPGTVSGILEAMEHRRITEGTVRDLLRLDGGQLQTLEAGLRELDA